MWIRRPILHDPNLSAVLSPSVIRRVERHGNAETRPHQVSQLLLSPIYSMEDTSSRSRLQETGTTHRKFTYRLHSAPTSTLTSPLTVSPMLPMRTSETSVQVTPEWVYDLFPLPSPPSATQQVPSVMRVNEDDLSPTAGLPISHTVAGSLDCVHGFMTCRHCHPIPDGWSTDTTPTIRPPLQSPGDRSTVFIYHWGLQELSGTSGRMKQSSPQSPCSEYSESTFWIPFKQLTEC
ncbi:hypothetical protein TREMEDRAFT_60410 [Tremella mesenterica DSM 1558]|uniref:uncharacterized protein n=1 Tax=Tremella mesenterica (strain ATCC 24925 / CBS 8224 / DSM 1558 / NBRC 9311 / NRRL Y-6157 / RJB 2259-6 / UBC 559-6) TaxID=578456 RepID=UPI0003F4A064|nr:uncharacterized protein TREMEDRAFT_60410 [Tremella mesenterica DSM 1558]EIW71484.1 hypothetical protein TREMEDRAFT_60410 [Tremella mesenterica DSM 1558]